MAQVTEVITDKGQLRFKRLYLFDLANAFHGPVLENIATQSIDRICGINNDAPAFKNLYHLADESFLWILWMNMDEHFVNLMISIRLANS
jgi:hypothetical protein